MSTETDGDEGVGERETGQNVVVWFVALAVGFVGFGVSVGAQFVGTDKSTAVNGSLVTSASPAFILLFAALILREKLTIQRLAAVALGVATLVVCWLVYDLLCRSPIVHRPAALALLGLVLVTALAWGLGQVFSARAAYLHVGAALGTIMAANVFRVIIPAQRDMVAALSAGAAPDAARGRQGALRSLHNNYLTLPVLFVMVSNHHPATYGSRWGWAILAVLFVIGVLVRHWFNLRNAGRRNGAGAGERGAQPCLDCQDAGGPPPGERRSRGGPVRRVRRRSGRPAHAV